MDYKKELEIKYKILLKELYSELSEKQLAEIVYDTTFNVINAIVKKEMLDEMVNERRSELLKSLENDRYTDCGIRMESKTYRNIKEESE